MALVQAVGYRSEYLVSQRMEVEVAPGRERPPQDPMPGHEEGGPTEDKGQGQAGKVAGRQARTKEVNIYDLKNKKILIPFTTLQSRMNAKLKKQWQ